MITVSEASELPSELPQDVQAVVERCAFSENALHTKTAWGQMSPTLLTFGRRTSHASVTIGIHSFPNLPVQASMTARDAEIMVALGQIRVQGSLLGLAIVSESITVPDALEDHLRRIQDGQQLLAKINELVAAGEATLCRTATAVMLNGWKIEITRSREDEDLRQFKVFSAAEEVSDNELVPVLRDMIQRYA